MEVLGRLLALLVVLLAGTGLRASGVLDAGRTATLNAVAYYVALPALIFVSTYDQAVGELLSPALVGGLLFVLFATAGVAWLSGLPMVFPSLGPSAFVLALFQDSDATAPRRVIGGHAIGVVAGLIAYHAFAGGVSMTSATAPGSLEGLRLAASAVLATMLTVGGMLATDTRHPPACATTLIVSLGLLSTPLEGAVILLAVIVLVAAHRLVLATERLGGRYRPSRGS